MDKPEANRPLTGEDVRYVDGYLDLNHVPSLGAFIGKSLATHVSGNRMPVMSGDNRERIPAHIRERFDRDCRSVASDIIAYRLSRPTRALTAHPDYNNTEHGDAPGWRGAHFTALCFDQAGRRMRNGGDFMRATREGTYPVWWIWPDQIVAALSPAPEDKEAGH